MRGEGVLWEATWDAKAGLGALCEVTLGETEATLGVL